MKEKMMIEEIRTIKYRWVIEPDGEIHTADVVVGDGSVVYDDNYPEYDDRIFFYFTDEEEFQLSFEGASDGVSGVEFVIVGLED
jgi:hypothetical protein